MALLHSHVCSVAQYDFSGSPRFSCDCSDLRSSRTYPPTMLPCDTSPVSSVLSSDDELDMLAPSGPEWTADMAGPLIKCFHYPCCPHGFPSPAHEVKHRENCSHAIVQCHACGLITRQFNYMSHGHDCPMGGGNRAEMLYKYEDALPIALSGCQTSYAELTYLFSGLGIETECVPTNWDWAGQSKPWAHIFSLDFNFTPSSVAYAAAACDVPFIRAAGPAACRRAVAESSTGDASVLGQVAAPNKRLNKKARRAARRGA